GEGNGYGELVDEGGADRYEVAAASEATADGGEPETGRVAATSATSAAADVFAQAAARALGHASLRDTGGSDGYSVAATSRAFAGDGTSSAGVARAGALASVDEGSSASFADADGGEPDVFSADPWIAACTGTRGGDAWVDCGGAGIGVVR
ncbi:MAG TPA: hypothetical protein VM638_02820, partial [Actinomycetota bacterium]|nr:hypothetical protein [Actinomycetota bacterium]